MTPSVAFDDADLHAWLMQAEADDVDAAPFGVIGFDAEHRVHRYNTTESRAAGISQERVLGQNLFLIVAPCMNNYLVAQRFVEAAETGGTLDEQIDYVLTLRMRPTPVRMRLLARPGSRLSYVVIARRGRP